MAAILLVISLVILVVAVSSHNKMKVNEKYKRFGNGNKDKYPNFRNALSSVFGNDLQLHADNGRVITYKIATLFLDKKVGETFFILGLSESSNYLSQLYRGHDGIEVQTDKRSLNTKSDISVAEYKKIISGFCLEIAKDARWIKSTSGISL